MRNAVKAIAVGGLLVGTLDLAQAMTLFGRKIPLAIAAGLLGRPAFHGGPAVYVLGIVLHYCIALSATAVYYAASRRLPFLTEYPLICGLVYGMLMENFMNLIVLPLSALHARGPYRLSDLLLGLGVHAVVVGLPIAYSVRRFAPRQRGNGILNG
jgi:hypothetical protein